MEFEDYKRFKWFYTLSGKLVVGGKSANQNDELLRRIKKSKSDFIVMHTSSPGSPFTIILSDIEKLSESDMEECAIFTGSFSRAWKQGKKKALVDIFHTSQLYKSDSMSVGTWGVKGKISHKNVELILALTKQKGVLRAIPLSSIKNKSSIIIKIIPGKIDKSHFLPKLQIEKEEHLNQDELLSALPAGGVQILRGK